MDKTEPTVKRVQPDIMKSPPDCPVCNGQTEWKELANGQYVAKCYFCGHAFRV